MCQYKHMLEPKHTCGWWDMRTACLCRPLLFCEAASPNVGTQKVPDLTHKLTSCCCCCLLPAGEGVEQGINEGLQERLESLQDSSRPHSGLIYTLLMQHNFAVTLLDMPDKQTALLPEVEKTAHSLGELVSQGS